MARRDSRSPSPTGSTRSAHRNRRDDDRYIRSDRDRRRLSRSRSREVGTITGIPHRHYHSSTDGYLQRRHYDHRERDRDRDGHRRRDRSLDRRRDDDDRRRDRDRGDRDRERRRSRSPRDRRERDRERERDRDRGRDNARDYRERRDDSRERRRRRDGSAEPHNRSKNDDTKATSSPVNKQSEEDKKKAERLAKLEAWKAKQAAERERKQKESEASAGGTRSLLQEMDRKAEGSPTTVSPAPLSPALPDPQSDPASPASPAPYAGKFDPKAIARKAATNATNKAILGADVGMQQSVAAKPALSSSQIPNGRPSITRPLNGHSLTMAGTAPRSLKPLKAKGNLSGFGLAKADAAAANAAAKRGIDLEEEETTRRKLEKLPTPPLGNTEDTAPANELENDDEAEDENMAEGGTEEEEAAAARAAAEKREERLQQMQTEATEATDGDVQMKDTTIAAKETVPMEEEEEEVDPLDAFMSGLGDAPKKPARPTKTLSKKAAQQQPEAMFSDAEDDMDTLDANPDDILAMASKRKKKDIPTVNHAKMDYESFRKSFYSEPTELAEMTEDDVASLRAELDGIKVRGVDIPKPVTKWAQCGLGVQTLDVIRELGYEAPTSIQCQAIPAIMLGRDVIGVAKTGSGKTIAFLMPMFRHIKDQRPVEGLDGPVGLIVAPTRELTTQIFRECRPFLKALNLRGVCAYGGAPIKDQIADLKRGAEIIVATPGRLIDLLAANSGRVTNLRRVTYCVLDEADRMFDMGFEPQVMKILSNIRPQKQTVLFSATFPRNMEALARKTLIKPVEIVVGGRSVVAPEITQIVEVRSEETKFIRLLELLGELFDKDDDARALIFVERQETADKLLSELLHKAYPCDSIHGGKDQIDRDSVINDFKAGVLPVMVATSVAARGLDVKQLKLVVNYDAPNHLEDYVHRAGRTGRAGNTGTAVTFLTEDQERYSVDIAKALKQSGQPVPEDVQKLVDAFLEKVKAGKEKAAATGFGGRGLEHLASERDAAKKRERGAYRTGDEDQQDEESKTSGDKVADDILAKATGGVGVQARDAPGAQAPASTAPPTPTTTSKPGMPSLDESQIKVVKTEKPESNASANPLDRVRAAVANIDDRLTKRGQLRPGQPIDNKGPDAGAFHATLEINDFPQKARWAVTNRTNVAKILEATGTSITTKGSFYAAGKEPQQGQDPKLYILVEGDTEVVVTNAMRELLRLLREGTVAAAEVDARAGASGRYSVV